MIEIVERTVCPTCGGNKVTKSISCTGSSSDMGVGVVHVGPCSECHGDGTVPRVLATFADAAALVAVLAPALRRAQWGHWGEYVPDGDETLSSLTDTAVEGYVAMARRVAEMALGVTNEPQ